MNPRELSTILAALRSWQVRNLPSVTAEQRQAIELIARDHGPALDAEEIDSLCERLNCGEVAADRPQRFRNHYKCTCIVDGEECGAEWTDEWDCACNDRCPNCNTEIEPFRSDDLTADPADVLRELVEALSDLKRPFAGSGGIDAEEKALAAFEKAESALAAQAEGGA